MSAILKKFNDQRAFTLMELMIVLVVIGILMASVFKLFSAVSANSDKARTTARLERLQNAISGFYSSYGTYPPVPDHLSSDPFNAEHDRGGGGSIPWSGDSGKANAAYWTCLNQPVAYEYPYGIEYDEFVNKKYQKQGILGANGVFGNAASDPDYLWKDVKMFKFGLMSFLLPRVLVTGVPGDSGGWGEAQPNPDFYRSEQWQHYNKTSRVGSDNAAKLTNALRGQRDAEMREAAKWMPNLEGIVSGEEYTLRNLMNINVYNDDHVVAYPGGWANAAGNLSELAGDYEHNGQRTLLRRATVVDGYGREFFYYSAPPYQSYRLWSAGPNGKTFPPWVPLETLSSADLKLVSEWVKDDVVGFDR